MLELLREGDLPHRFRALKKKAVEVTIAVPFWGDGAIEMLGLGTIQKARVLCNLTSNACNPHVIEKLKGLKRIKIRSNPRLHAKIYATQTFAIIGSSNASKMGLTIEGETLRSWIEANVLSDDRDLVNDAIRLFEEIWKSKETVRISTKNLREAKTRWDNRPRPAPQAAGKATTLLAACRKNPELFGSVFVVAYTDPLGPKGEKRLTDLRKDARPPAPGFEARDFRNAWAYQFDGRIKPGSWLVDLDCKNPAKPKVWGCCQMTELCLKVPGEYDLAIAIRRPVHPVGMPRPLRLSSAEKQALIDNSQRIVQQPEIVVPLVKAVRIIDRARKH